MAWLTRRWWKRNWTIVTSFLILFCNVEFVVMPALVWLKVRDWNFFFIAVVFAAVELAYWYIVPLDRFKELATTKAIGTPLFRETVGDLRERGFLELVPKAVRYAQFVMRSIFGYFINDFAKKDDVERYKNSKPFKAIAWATVNGGYLMSGLFMAAMGIMPLVWVIGIAITRSQRWHFGFVCLLIGNSLKTYWMALGVGMLIN